MKNFIYLFFVWGLFSSSISAQFDNSGFESWTNMGSYETPDNWGTMNNFTSGSGIYTATKGTPGSPGSSYLKLTSQLIGNTVTNGIAVSGVLNPTTQQAVSGFAFNQQPMSFNGKWQHMIYGSSQGSITVTLTRWDNTLNARVVVATANKVLVGMAMSWANFTIPFIYLDGQAPDSCIILMKASGMNPAQNDYLWVDNLSFVGDVSGIEDINSMSNSPILYPNPTANQITFIYNSIEEEDVLVNIYSLSGDLIRTEVIRLNVGKENYSINIEGLNQGNYFLLLDKSGEQIQLPFIVNN